jgi:hypothetical protein
MHICTGLAAAADDANGDATADIQLSINFVIYIYLNVYFTQT